MKNCLVPLKREKFHRVIERKLKADQQKVCNFIELELKFDINFLMNKVSTVPDNEATNDSISFEEVSVKEEAPDYENMVQMEDFGSADADPIGINNVENSADLTDGSKFHKMAIEKLKTKM